MKKIRTILLFSNDAEITAVLDSGYCNKLNLWNILTNDHWLMRFNTNERKFEVVNPTFDFSKLTGGEIFVVYDGEYNDKEKNEGKTNKLVLDDPQLKILRWISKNSSRVHIAFHTKPTLEKKNAIKGIFPDRERSEEAPIPRHESQKDGFIYSQVYNSLYKLYQDSDNYQQVEFFGQQISDVDEMIDVIFERANKTTSLNNKLELLHQLLTPEGIINNEEKVTSYIKAYKLESNLHQLETLDFMDKDYQKFLVELRDYLLDNGG